MPWIDRQPSSATSVSSPRSTISGLTTATTSSSFGWKTKTRWSTPTWFAASPGTGQPLRQRYRNFRPDADASIRALSGPPVWMRRLRAIEDELDRHQAELTDAWQELAAETTDAAEFARRWHEIAGDWSFA